MKKYMLKMAIAVLLLPVFLFAEGAIDDPIALETWLLAIVTFATTVKGMSALAIAAGVVQLLMIGFKTPLASFAGKWRLTIVAVLSVVALIVANLAMGGDIISALGMGPVLAALQIAGNQIWKQFFEKAS